MGQSAEAVRGHCCALWDYRVSILSIEPSLPVHVSQINACTFVLTSTRRCFSSGLSAWDCGRRTRQRARARATARRGDLRQRTRSRHRARYRCALSRIVGAQCLGAWWRSDTTGVTSRAMTRLLLANADGCRGLMSTNKCHAIADSIEALVERQFEVDDITVHIEPDVRTKSS